MLPRLGLLTGLKQAYSSEVTQSNEAVGEGQLDYAEVCAPENGEILKYVLEKAALGLQLALERETI